MMRSLLGGETEDQGIRREEGNEGTANDTLTQMKGNRWWMNDCVSLEKKSDFGPYAREKHGLVRQMKNTKTMVVLTRISPPIASAKIL